jgi:putative ABC transport system permease protein
MKAFFFVGAMALGATVAVSALATLLSLLAMVVLAIVAKWVPVVYNVRSLARRRLTTLMTVAGMALVVFVFSSVLMLLQGIKRTLVTAGRDDNVMVLRKGATAEITSAVEREQAKLLSSLDEVAPDPKDGKPLVDPQVSVLIFAQRPGGEATDGTNVLVRGLTEKTLPLHEGVRVVEGRWFSPGTSEIVIGRSLIGRFVGASLGSEMNFARRGWKVVGIVDGAGSSYDSEVWCDIEQAMSAFQRVTYSQVTMRLKSASLLSSVIAKLAGDQRLQLDVKPEQKYFEDQSTGLRTFLGFMGIFVAVVFSIGATLGAMISMYGQVAARLREVGTLRALGFRRSSVLVSFVVESVLLGLASGVLGVAASALMRFASFTTMNFSTFSEVTFRFALTPSVVGWSMGFAALMGYVGGVLPAVRAARMPIVQATRG